MVWNELLRVQKCCLLCVFVRMYVCVYAVLPLFDCFRPMYELKIMCGSDFIYGTTIKKSQRIFTHTQCITRRKVYIFIFFSSSPYFVYSFFLLLWYTLRLQHWNYIYDLTVYTKTLWNVKSNKYSPNAEKNRSEKGTEINRKGKNWEKRCENHKPKKLFDSNN